MPSWADSGYPYRYNAGRAFVAARRQSYTQLRQKQLGDDRDVITDLTRELEASPRRYRQLDRRQHARPGRKQSEPTDLRKTGIENEQPAPALTNLSNISEPSLVQAQGSNACRQVTESPQHTLPDSPRSRQDTPAFTFPPPVTHTPTPPSQAAKFAAIGMSSNGTTTRPRVSFDAPSPIHTTLTPDPPLTAPALVDRRSSLEARIHRSLRGLSIDNTNASITINPDATPFEQLKPRPPVSSIARTRRKIVGMGNGGTGGAGIEHVSLWRGPRLMKSTSGLGFSTMSSSSSPSSSSSINSPALKNAVASDEGTANEPRL